MKPIGSRILVKPDPIDGTTKSGIIIPDAAKQKPHTGEVVAVGPGTSADPMTLEVGDRIIYGQYSGTEITVEEETYMLMLESEVFGLV